jgi:hypothetical protein
MFLVLAHEFAWCVLMLKMNDVSMDRFEKNEAGVSGTRVVLLHGGHACFVEAERCSHVEVPHFQECLSCCIQNMCSLFVHLCPVVGHPRHVCVHLAVHEVVLSCPNDWFVLVRGFVVRAERVVITCHEDTGCRMNRGWPEPPVVLALFACWYKISGLFRFGSL